jgi:bud site selection protein 20
MANFPLSRVKNLKEEPYTQKEAEAAIGLRTDNEGPKRTSSLLDDEVVMTT